VNEPRPTPSTEVRHIPVEIGHETIEQTAEIHPAVEQSSVAPAEFDVAVPVQPVTPVVATSATDAQAYVQRVESILSDGLAETYQGLDPATQIQFRRVGEETATTVARMLQQTKVQVQKVVQLILVWLKIIPHANPYFLEQEAKIKADALLAMRHSVNDQLPPPV
jgi:hypothetical protein